MKTILQHIEFEMKRQEKADPYSVGIFLNMREIWAYKYYSGLSGLFKEVYSDDFIKDLIVPSGIILGSIPKSNKKKYRK